MDFNEKIVSDIQDALRDLTKVMHELTLTITSHRGDFNTAFAKLTMVDDYLKEQIVSIKLERKESEKTTSNRVFEIFKILLPWTVAGLAVYFGIAKTK